MSPSERAQPLTLSPPGPAIERLVEALTARGVPRSLIALGRFPLIDERLPPGQTLPLLSATSPPNMSPEKALQSLTPILLQGGYELTASDRAWSPGRPSYAGVTYEGHPVLALRLSPSGPRLCVIMSPPPPEEVAPRLLRRLPEHLTFALDLNALGSMATYDYLSSAARELILSSPAQEWSARGLSSPLSGEDNPDLAARWRAELSALRTHAHLSGLMLPPRALVLQDLPYLNALAEELKVARVTLIEPVSSLSELSVSALRAQGVRRLKVTHELSSAEGLMLEELKRVEASLVLEGHATLWVPPLRREAWRVFTAWLTELTLHKGVWLMRASEVAL